MLRNFIDGFKPLETPAEHAQSVGSATPTDEKGDDFMKSQHDDTSLERMPQDSNTKLRKTLQARHVYFIAMGGGIGTGLFIGAGGKLSSGGPASLLIGYGIVGLMLLSVIFALGELATIFPVTGAFSTYATRFVEPAWGFAIGYNYWMQWVTTLPLEFTAATIVVSFWDSDYRVPMGVYVAIFFFLMFSIHFFGAKGYAEFEFCATTLKICTIIGFVIFAIVIDCGGGPTGEYIGARYWHDPGAFENGFKGMCTVFSAAAFAFQGTEIVGLAAAETSEPRKIFPKVWKLVLIRVVCLYLLSLLMIGMLISAKDPGLIGTSDYDPKTSPFVLSIKNAGVRVLPHIVNAVILLSALSVANSCVYGGSRTLLALSEQNFAPKCFQYIDRRGRPILAVAASLAFGLLGFLIYSSNPGNVFNWLLGVSGLSTIFTYSVTCFAHIRFRQAWAKSGRSFSELPWISPLGVWGSWFGFALNMIVLCAFIYVSAFPVGEGKMGPQDRATDFFKGMISLPIVLAFYLSYKLVKRSKFRRLDEIDLDTGRRMPLEREAAADDVEVAHSRTTSVYGDF